jgi:hypothetical protein
MKLLVAVATYHRTIAYGVAGYRCEVALAAHLLPFEQ